MGFGAGRKLAQILSNVRRVIAIEILCAVQGVEYRAPLRPGTGVAAVVDLVRSHVPPLQADRPLSEEIEVVSALVADGSIATAVGP
jgi:histidine ammonia-lyase